MSGSAVSNISFATIKHISKKKSAIAKYNAVADPFLLFIQYYLLSIILRSTLASGIWHLASGIWHLASFTIAVADPFLLSIQYYLLSIILRSTLASGIWHLASFTIAVADPTLLTSHS